MVSNLLQSSTNHSSAEKTITMIASSIIAVATHNSTLVATKTTTTNTRRLLVTDLLQQSIRSRFFNTLGDSIRNHVVVMGVFSSKPTSSSTPVSLEPPASTAEIVKSHSNQGEEVKKTSKNQLKRQRKWEQAMEVKRRRKEQERNVRLAQAKVDGRDIEKERKIQEENRKAGAGWAKRDLKWKQAFDKNSSKYQICLDCSFEDVMIPKEINSLASQIRYCYASNKRAKHPVNVKVTSLGGTTLDRLENVSGFDQWKHKAFECTSQSIAEVYDDKSKVVYLTSDSDNVLDSLEDGKVYVIGGIVDRNRLKRAAINRADELGFETARLPISYYLSMVSTKVLTCNHVFEILLKYREHGNDWKKAFLDVLPNRKDAQVKDGDE
eukprot:scaffold1869_cov122-Cylindrotheca_fusiformis.AAC.21